MKFIDIKNKNLNNGEKTRLLFPIPEDDMKGEVYEILEQEHYKAGKKKCDVLVDLGANVGLASLYFKDTAKKIYAIEPSIECYQCLVENTRDYPNIIPCNFAISAIDSRSILYTDGDGTVPQTFYPSVEKRGYLVNAYSIETFMKVNKIKHIDVLKIDVEGAEYLILPSLAFKRMAKNIDIIVGEAHFINKAYPDVIPEILKDYGFKTKFIPLEIPNLNRQLYYDEGKYHKEYKVGYNTFLFLKDEESCRIYDLRFKQ